MSLDRFSRAAGVSSNVGQATTIEQSRAIAQVQAAVIVAQQRPRDELRAATKVREACRVLALAEQAFFNFKRGGSRITGETIRLAEEIARCWGNMEYGIVELSRDDMKGESEMMAVAWDYEANMRVSNTFIVPHRRDKTGDDGNPGFVDLVSLRDIYENNTNQGARRLRECIFRIVPKTLIQEATAICRETLAKGDGTPLPVRREKLLVAFNDLGINRERIERRLNMKADRLTDLDIVNLGILYHSIRRGEAVAEEEFPPLVLAGADSFQSAGSGAVVEEKKKEEPKEKRPAPTATAADATKTAAKVADKPAPKPPAAPATPAATTTAAEAATASTGPASATATHSTSEPPADPFTVIDMDGVVHEVVGARAAADMIKRVITEASRRGGVNGIDVVWENNESTVKNLPDALAAEVTGHWSSAATGATNQHLDDQRKAAKKKGPAEGSPPGLLEQME